MAPPFDPYLPVGPSPGDAPDGGALLRCVPAGLHAEPLAEPLAEPEAGVATPSFDRVFEENAAYVWRVLRRLGVPSADIKDVCQEVFIVVHGKLATYDGRSSISTWLWGFCRRKASEYRRANAHAARVDLVEALPEQEDPPAQETTMDRRAKLRLLDAALATLDEEKRFVFVLHGIEEVPMKEIAEICGCPLQTAYSRYHAAQKHVEAAVRRLQRSAA
jgi:RNA polymerase sigma-70 factor (ECF subfamily)